MEILYGLNIGSLIQRQVPPLCLSNQTTSLLAVLLRSSSHRCRTDRIYRDEWLRAEHTKQTTPTHAAASDCCRLRRRSPLPWMVILQCLYGQLLILQGADSGDAGAGSAEVGIDRDLVGNGGAADHRFVLT
jgi:hypothetical protein